MNPNLSLEMFLDRLATASPTPGGGSVAALAGAAGAGLVSMVCHLTLPKTEDGDRIERLALVSDRADELRRQLTSLVERDARSYDDVIAAYRLPKDTDAERQLRRTSIQRALKLAATVPAETADAALEVLELAREIVPDATPSAISDIAVAAHMSLASLVSAWVNVRINLGSIRDEAFVAPLQARDQNDRERAAVLHRETVAIVEEILQKARS
ncbi:cyclodeaminase/cyclohydrolase family protein [Candidatus Bipolaricaulota bacterium]|nr:cyclodeaminase/cyclohydrolase family protein [Candidatus Bipolaricaulota bacterium]